MSQKDFYDEDEVINSLVNEKTPQPNSSKEENRNEQFHNQFPKGVQFQVGQTGCGCFDTRKLIINLAIYTIVLMATSGLLPGFYLSGITAAIRAALTLTLLNTFVKPLIIFFTFPITVATMGLFYFAINGIIIMMTSSIMGADFRIDNFLTALLAALVISLIQSAIKKYILKVDQL